MFSLPAILNQGMPLVEYCPLDYLVNPPIIEDKLILYLDGNTLTDRSANNQQVLGNGVLTSFGGRTCYDFTVKERQIHIPNNALIPTVNGTYKVPFTVQFWYCKQTEDNNRNYLFGTARKASSGRFPQLNYIRSSLQFLTTDSNFQVSDLLQYDLTPGNWYQLTAIYVNQEIKIFVNGIYQGTIGTFNDTSSSDMYSNIFVIGGTSHFNNSPVLFARGYITKFAIFKGIRYRTNFDPNIDPLDPPPQPQPPDQPPPQPPDQPPVYDTTIISYCPLNYTPSLVPVQDSCILYLDGTSLTDKSQYNQTVLGNGILTTYAGLPCYDFTLQGNRIFIPNNARIELAQEKYQSPFTVEFWFNRADGTSAVSHLFSAAIKGSTGRANPPKLNYAKGNIYSSPYQVNLNIDMAISEWNHIAVVYVNQEIRLYYNGKYVGKSGYFDDTEAGYFNNSAINSINGDQFIIGGDTQNNYSTSYFARGYITKFRITKGIKYKQNFNPNTGINLPNYGLSLSTENILDELISEDNNILKEE